MCSSFGLYTLSTNFVNNLYYVNTFVMQINRFRQRQQTHSVFVSFQLAASGGQRHSRRADVVDEKLIESADGRGSSLLVTSHLPQMFDVPAQLARTLCSANNIKTGSPA